MTMPLTSKAEIKNTACIQEKFITFLRTYAGLTRFQADQRIKYAIKTRQIMIETAVMTVLIVSIVVCF